MSTQLTNSQKILKTLTGHLQGMNFKGLSLSEDRKLYTYQYRNDIMCHDVTLDLDSGMIEATLLVKVSIVSTVKGYSATEVLNLSIVTDNELRSLLDQLIDVKLTIKKQYGVN